MSHSANNHPGISYVSGGQSVANSVGKTDTLNNVTEEPNFSNDAEIAKYIDNSLAAAGLPSAYQLESEEFLKSLPPIKPINLDAYTAAPLLPPPKPVEKKRKPVAKKQVTSNSTGLSVNQQTDSSGVKSRPLETVREAAFEPQVSSSNVTMSSHQRSADHPLDSSQNNASPAVSFTVSASAAVSDTSAMYKKQVDDILKEKAKLLGQVEILTQESQNVLQVS